MGRKGKTRTLSLESSSEDGNEPSPCASSPHPPSPSTGGGPREETSDVISKEKQKFFRGSAFYRGPKSERATNHDRSPVITPVTPLTPFPRHVPPIPSSSSCTGVTTLTSFPQPVPPLTATTLPENSPFGQLGADSGPWGFAAAALSAQHPSPETSNAPAPHLAPPPQDSEPDPPTLTPLLRKRKKEATPSQSSLIKSAVCCKSAEVERRKQLSGGERSRRMEEATGRAGKVPPTTHLPSRPYSPLWQTAQILLSSYLNYQICNS